MKTLSESPTFHPSAVHRDSVLGTWMEIGANTSIAALSIGAYSYLMQGCQVIYSHIRKFCSLASFVRLNPGSYPLERPNTHHMTYRAAQFGFGEDKAEFFEWRRSTPVTVGYDVWISHHVTVMPGATISNGAASGSGAGVTKDVEAYNVAVGVPAKPLKSRFDDQTAERLDWWDWLRDVLEAHFADFRSDIHTFLDKYVGLRSHHDTTTSSAVLQ